RSPAAGNNYVGIAGLGLDAAAYQAGDPAVVKKLGVFGYDRETKVAEITNGLDKTIAVIQVPPRFKTCLLAGRGSTVRGVPEKGSCEEFICTQYKGKDGQVQKGTFAIMCDGKVRFISEDILRNKPDLFRAMCTIAGGEKLDNIDEIAPVVPSSSTT